MITYTRKFTAFEKLLFAVGMFVMIAGIFLFRTAYALDGWSTTMIVAIFSWLLLVFMIIIAAIAENAREDIAVIVKEMAQEVRLLRDISAEHLQEMKYLREQQAKAFVPATTKKGKF